LTRFHQFGCFNMLPYTTFLIKPFRFLGWNILCIRVVRRLKNRWQFNEVRCGQACNICYHFDHKNKIKFKDFQWHHMLTNMLKSEKIGEIKPYAFNINFLWHHKNSMKSVNGRNIVVCNHWICNHMQLIIACNYL